MKRLILILSITLLILGVVNNNGVYGMFGFVGIGLWRAVPEKESKNLK